MSKDTEKASKQQRRVFLLEGGESDGGRGDGGVGRGGRESQQINTNQPWQRRDVLVVFNMKQKLVLFIAYAHINI